MATIEDEFTNIFIGKRWIGKSDESVSGSGSTLRYTENLRAELPAMLKKFNITSMLDAPCGDMNWMGPFLEEYSIEYIGGDIVQPLVVQNSEKYPHLKFIHMDITEDHLPSVDMMMVRDCLFHLPTELVLKFFEHFKQSNIKYLFTTTHNAKINKDVTAGKYRQINLFKPPYNLPDPLYTIEDYMKGYDRRLMVLFDREQL